MRLYYLGSKSDLAAALREDWYTEWSIGFGRRVLLRAGRPVAASDAVIALEIPDAALEDCAGVADRPGEFLVPAAIVKVHDPTPRIASGTLMTRPAIRDRQASRRPAQFSSQRSPGASGS